MPQTRCKRSSASHNAQSMNAPLSPAGLALAAFLAFMATATLPGPAMAGGSEVLLGQLQFGTTSPGRFSALQALAQEVARRTSVEASVRPHGVSPSEELYSFPVLFLSGQTMMPVLAPEQGVLLAGWLRGGGTLIVDWSGGGAQMERFRTTLDDWVAQVIPGSHIERVPRSSVVYRSFYRVRHATGRIRLADDLYGVLLDGRYAILVCFNDLLSAMDRDASGEYRQDVVPGGDAQREEAIRLAVNLVMYVMCLNYKDDKVHMDYLKSKRNWQLPNENE